MAVRVSTSPTEIYDMRTPSLSSLGMTNGVMVGFDIFQYSLLGIVDFLELKWNENQLRECAQLAYDEYYWFNLAEVKQFCLLVKTGTYESHKNISPALLLGFMEDYASRMRYERAEYYNKPVKSNRHVPNPDLLPELDRQLRENKIAYKQGKKNHEAYLNDYNRLFAEYQANTPVSDEQFAGLIAKFTERAAQTEEQAEHRLESERLQRIKSVDARKQEYLNSMSPEQKAEYLRITKEHQERAEKITQIENS